MTSTGLAFSGGGIRSAAFCSGVLRRLLQYDVEVDYLSCVSGAATQAQPTWTGNTEKEGGRERRVEHKEIGTRSSLIT